MPEPAAMCTATALLQNSLPRLLRSYCHRARGEPALEHFEVSHKQGSGRGGFLRTNMYSHAGETLALQCGRRHTHTRSFALTASLALLRTHTRTNTHTYTHTQNTSRCYRLVHMSLSHSRMIAYAQSLARACLCTLRPAIRWHIPFDRLIPG